MEDPKNFAIDSNAYNNYYNQTDNNYDLNQDKNVTAKAKEIMKNFRNQYLSNIDSNERILNTDINQMPQNYPGYQMLSAQNKAREDLNSYDFYFGSSRGPNRNITPTRNNNFKDNTEHNIDLMNLENAKLKKHLKELEIENKNLQNRLNNNNNNYPSPIILKDNNNFNNMNSINRQEQMIRVESDNNMNINNINNNNINNLQTIPLNDKKFFEESIESIIKTNMRLGQNNNEIKKNINELKRIGNYKMGYPRKNNNYNRMNYNPNINYNYNNNYINNQNENINPYTYSNMNNNLNNNLNINNNMNNNNERILTMNDYNQLLDDYRTNKIKLENLQLEMENKKDIFNKYRMLNSNYSDLQNRNKELVLTVQKMKNDNTVLTRHIEDLNKQKKI